MPSQTLSRAMAARYGVGRTSRGLMSVIVAVVAADGDRHLVDGVVAAIGEPWLSGFAPRNLIDSLAQLGFGHIEDLGPAELNARYFEGRDDGLRILAGRVARART